MPDLDLIVFSKDRPAQLDLLLRSLQRCVLGDRRVRARVLFAASDGGFAAGYRLVGERHGARVQMVGERSFRDDTRALLADATPAVLFLVDDVVVLKPFGPDLPALRAFLGDRTLACLSLRLHPGIKRCYTKGHETPPPAFLPGLRWAWRGQAGDWGYPMSLDGHVFRREDIVPLVATREFRHPNSLESVLAEQPLAQELMVCQPAASVVNIPANRVQGDFPNRSMGGDVAAMNRRFLAGEELDLEAVLAAHTGEAVHQEIELRFLPARAAVGQVAVAQAAPPSPSPAQPSAMATDAASAIAALLATGRTRVHLGCGDNHLPGFINIDLPAEGGFQQRARPPDVIGDFTRMAFPDASLQEVYAAHVFEHFQRQVAVGFLVRWHRWLRPGGILRLEMPDIEACMREFIPAPLERRLQLIRHLWGSHEAAWASHHEGWMPDYAALAFAACGFEVIDLKRIGGRWPAFEISGRRQGEVDWRAVEQVFAAMCPGDVKLPARWVGEARRIGAAGEGV